MIARSRRFISSLAPVAVAAAAIAAAPPGASAAPAAASSLPLTAGAIHTCAATSSGEVKCWGSNAYGQLGNPEAQSGPGAANPRPVSVSGLTRTVTALASSGTHTCALTGAGTVECWGSNHWGQLGDGTTSDRPTPADVSGLGSGVVAIAANGGNGGGAAYSCALTSGGGVKCWGANANLQGGTAPVAIAGLESGVAGIAIGDGYGCALTSAGGVKCWGANGLGQLGDGSAVPGRSTPVDVVGLGSGVRAIAAGRGHTCALTTGGGVKCWGWNGAGQLGDGTTSNQHTPVDVAGLGSGVVAIAARFDQTCALTSAGGVKCWGYNSEGQLGDGTNVTRHTPVAVSGLGSGVVAVAVGYYHTCARLATGGVKCWGSNMWGQLGDGTTKSSPTPVDVVGLVSPSTGSTTALTAYGRSIETDLSQLARGRARLSSTLAGIARCSLTPQAASARLATVIANRRLILRRLRALHAPTAQAARISSLLASAVAHSIAADRQYLNWLRYLQGRPRCSRANNRDYVAAQREDRLATKAKQRFVAAFNPLARRLHLRTRSAARF